MLDFILAVAKVINFAFGIFSLY